jgi:hypothetical protein
MTNAEINAALDGHKGQDVLLNAPEISVWMTAFGCLRQMGDIQQAYENKKISRKEYYASCNQMLVELAETADATHRFGVLLPSAIEPYYKRRIKNLDDAFLRVQFSPSFWRWFNWWDDYMKAKTDSERATLYHLVTARLAEVDSFRPAGDWLSYRSDAVLSLSRI